MVELFDVAHGILKNLQTRETTSLSGGWREAAGKGDETRSDVAGAFALALSGLPTAVLLSLSGVHHARKTHALATLPRILTRRDCLNRLVSVERTAASADSSEACRRDIEWGNPLLLESSGQRHVRNVRYARRVTRSRDQWFFC